MTERPEKRSPDTENAGLNRTVPVSVSPELARRLSRVEGQFQGIRKMIGEGRDCLDVIQQVNAVREAVTMLGVELLKDDLVCRRKIEGLDERFLKTVFRMR